MSNGRIHVATYRRLTALYPHAFRQHYRDDLVAIFTEQLRDDPAARVWLRTLLDLAVTVPTQQLEAHMHRSSSKVVGVATAGLSAAAGLLTIVLGGPAPSWPFLLIALVAGTVAVLSWRAGRPISVGSAAARTWWKFLVAGGMLAVVTFSAMAIPWPDSMDIGFAYFLALFGILASLTLAAIGLVLGLAALLHYRRRPALGS